ncbi:porphobilinogen synthase [Arsenophonus symbiont of Ornithomya chloropus]|uniref:porphobilinogen synthase n=1 Tax=Arsenophonus symbiont of Ornithomya chloropus TaxID=634121 RepID=UPI0032B13A7F
MRYQQNIQRLRRLRQTKSIRNLFQETNLSINDLILPLFIEENIQDYQAITSMPGIFRIPENKLPYEIERIAKSGLKSVMLFGVSHNQDAIGSDTWKENGLIARMSKICKNTVPEIIVISDTCFCQYTSHGHCGILKRNTVDNDKTLLNLQKQAITAANAGADFIAPSAAMDGQVFTIRNALNKAGFIHTGIMSYSTKFASNLYNSFREAIGSSLIGDRKSYQINPMNRNEAIRESLIDEKEGADILMIKPAGTSLDIIRDIRERTTLPLAAYQVSGEFSLIKFAAKAGVINEIDVVLETLSVIKRAGATLILSYFALDLAEKKQI